MVSYLVHYDTLLHNAINVITKRDKSLLQCASGLLLQNATVTTKCVDFITKCDNYHKMQCLL